MSDLKAALARVDEVQAGVTKFDRSQGATIRVDDQFVPPPAPGSLPSAAEVRDADWVRNLEFNYRGCLTGEQTAAWAAEQMEDILDELKRLHGIH